MKSRLVLLSASLGLLHLVSAGVVEVFQYPTANDIFAGDVSASMEGISRNGRMIVFEDLETSGRFFRYDTWEKVTTSIDFNKLLTDFTGDYPSFDSIGAYGDALVFSYHDGTQNWAHIWTDDLGLMSYGLGDGNFSGKSGDGRAVFGINPANETFVLTADGDYTILGGTKGHTPLYMDKTGKNLLSYGSFDDHYTAILHSETGAQPIFIDDHYTSPLGISGDGQTVAFTFIPNENETYDPTLYLLRDGEYRDIPLDLTSGMQMASINQLSDDGQIALLRVYESGAMPGNDPIYFGFTFYLYRVADDQLINLNSLLLEALPDDILSVQNVQLDLSGNAIQVYGYDKGDQEVVFSVSGLDTLVVPEPETYALMALGVSLLGAYAWSRRRRTA